MAKTSIRFDGCSCWSKVTTGGYEEARLTITGYGSGYAKVAGRCRCHAAPTLASYDPGSGLCRNCDTYCDGDCLAQGFRGNLR